MPFAYSFLVSPSSEKCNLVNTYEKKEYNIYLNFSSYKFYKNVLREIFARPNNLVLDKFFIEAGAMDGQYQSNTLFLEEDLHWTGLLIEPDYGMFQMLLKKNRKAWSANVCLSPHSYPYKVNIYLV